MIDDNWTELCPRCDEDFGPYKDCKCNELTSDDKIASKKKLDAVLADIDRLLKEGPF